MLGAAVCLKVLREALEKLLPWAPGGMLASLLSFCREIRKRQYGGFREGCGGSTTRNGGLVRGADEFRARRVLDAFATAASTLICSGGGVGQFGVHVRLLGAAKLGVTMTAGPAERLVRAT